jgi:putative PIN family toxin of toxin-antitoxin system
MSAPKTARNNGIVISALHARSNFGQLLRRVEKDKRGLVIEKRGTPRAILLSIRDYVRLASPEPEVLKVIGEESKHRGTDTLTSRQIDLIINATRARKTKSRKIKPRK